MPSRWSLAPRGRGPRSGRALLGAFVLALVLSLPVAVPASAAPTPTPPKPTPSTATLPVPKATVDPRLAVGGEKLAGMGILTDLPPGVPAPPTLRNVSWVLADADTGEVVAAKAPHARLLPASTLKALAALVLIPKVPATTVVTATQDAANADGTRVGIVPGLDYSARQLFQAMLMASGNDAAYALAEAGGGREATLAAMNEQAAYLGAHDTVAKDPSGLDAPGQTSSAYDLALIGRAALQVGDLRGYVTTKQIDFPGRVDAKTKKRQTYKVDNHNKLLYNYEGTIGLKNGYTELAHRTFISAVTRKGKTYLLSEMYGLEGSWRPQAAMYDWAFAYGNQAKPVGELVNPGSVTTPPTLAPTTPPTMTGATADAQDAATSQATAPPAALRQNSLLGRGAASWTGLAALTATALLLVGLVTVVRRRRQAARH